MQKAKQDGADIKTEAGNSALIVDAAKLARFQRDLVERLEAHVSSRQGAEALAEFIVDDLRFA